MLESPIPECPALAAAGVGAPWPGTESLRSFPAGGVDGVKGPLVLLHLHPSEHSLPPARQSKCSPAWPAGGCSLSPTQPQTTPTQPHTMRGPLRGSMLHAEPRRGNGPGAAAAAQAVPARKKVSRKTRELQRSAVSSGCGISANPPLSWTGAGCSWYYGPHSHFLCFFNSEMWASVLVNNTRSFCEHVQCISLGTLCFPYRTPSSDQLR